MYLGFPEEGDKCQERGCSGTLIFPSSENCSCHINAPCFSCTSVRLECDKCGWVDDSEDEVIVQAAPGLSIIESRPKPLDKTKIDYRAKMHSSSSMIKEGVYPEGTTKEQVREVVKGTFGGTFKSFGNGRFVFIAYTD